MVEKLLELIQPSLLPSPTPTEDVGDAAERQAGNGAVNGIGTGDADSDAGRIDARDRTGDAGDIDAPRPELKIAGRDARDADDDDGAKRDASRGGEKGVCIDAADGAGSGTGSGAGSGTGSGAGSGAGSCARDDGDEETTGKDAGCGAEAFDHDAGTGAVAR